MKITDPPVMPRVGSPNNCKRNHTRLNEDFQILGMAPPMVPAMKVERRRVINNVINKVGIICNVPERN